MTTMPQIEIVAEADAPSALLRMGDRIQPDIVLLDASLPEQEVWAALKQIQSEWSQTHTIVLAEDSKQQQRAMEAGADVALLKGFPAAKLAAVMESFLVDASRPAAE
jgi:DNA-binding NarL/FixJ family response regulator